MPSVDRDLGYLSIAVELLEDYLLSKEIFWRVNLRAPRGEPGYPSLTLGGILLAQIRLQARELTSTQSDHFYSLDDEVNKMSNKWRIAWENKAKNEFRIRLNLWRNFLEDYRQNPSGNADRYGYEVSRRVMLHLLEQEAREIPLSERNLLSGLDRILSGVLIEGDFVWDEDMVAGFPEQTYPYLYGELKT
jgi:hypothetical protein